MHHQGLTTHEGKTLLAKVGPNKITETRSFSFFGHLLAEVFSFLNILLIIAALVALAIGDVLDSVLIVLIVLLNTIISFAQEYKAEKTLSELKKISHTLNRVIRDNKETLVDSEQLVPGDVIVLEIGDKVPADAHVLESINFEANESALTGESVGVYKKENEPEHNQIFAGTTISSGRGKAKIFATADQTRFGKIAKTLTKIKDPETPLQKQIKNLALNIGFVAVALSMLIYLLGTSLGFDKLTIFLTAISTAVAAIPEGLPAIIIITLAVGVKRMALRKAVVRKMVVIEALGSINIICTDKTGTLTRGEMKVAQIFFNNRFYSVAEFRQIKNQDHAEKFLSAIIVPNTASLLYKFDHGAKAILGDSTEGALLLFGSELGIDYELRKSGGRIIDEFSFDQKLKSMGLVWEVDGKIEALVKSSPEAMVLMSTRVLINGQIKLLKEEDKQVLIDSYTQLASEGLRVLGFGYKNNLKEKTKYERDEVESDLVFLGFLGLADPVRPEVFEALNLAKQAGIRTVMITGDNELTAMNIAKQLGLAKEGDEAILGKDLEKITDDELLSVITKIKVFARTNPEDKLRIVRAFQRLGLSVAVTGDGVNDALALKQAEIGIAMGKKGTDVAKEAADMVITDDNYATIVKAIEEGRTIYDNVLKSIRYLVSTNISELLTILIALIVGLPAPLVPAQILWINLVSDGLPAIALALDPKDPQAMKKLPRSKDHKLVDIPSLVKLLSIGLVCSCTALIVYWLVFNLHGNLVLARTWTFTVLIVLQMIVPFIIRGKNAGFNQKLVLAVVVTLFIQVLILAIPPLYPIFKIQSPF